MEQFKEKYVCVWGGTDEKGDGWALFAPKSQSRGDDSPLGTCFLALTLLFILVAREVRLETL